MNLYPKNLLGPIPIGIIVFLGVFMVDPAMIFSKGEPVSVNQNAESGLTASKSSEFLPYQPEFPSVLPLDQNFF